MAQPAGKVYRVGILHLTPDLARMEAFRDGLSPLGHVEGQNVAILDRLAEGKVNRLPELAAELVRLKVDVIVTGGATATAAAKQATSAIPIIMAADDNPVEDGFVASSGRCGGGSWGFLGRPAAECGRLCERDGRSRTRPSRPDGANVAFAQGLGELVVSEAGEVASGCEGGSAAPGCRD